MQFTCGYGEPFGVWVGKGDQGGGEKLVCKGNCMAGCACSKPLLFPFSSSAKTHAEPG